MKEIRLYEDARYTISLVIRWGSWWVGVHRSKWRTGNIKCGYMYTRCNCINILPCITVKVVEHVVSACSFEGADSDNIGC